MSIAFLNCACVDTFRLGPPFPQQHVLNHTDRALPADVVSVLQHAFGPAAVNGGRGPKLVEPSSVQMRLAQVYVPWLLEHRRSFWVTKIKEGQCRASGLSGKTTCQRAMEHPELMARLLAIDPALNAGRLYRATKRALMGRNELSRALCKQYCDGCESTCHFLENAEVRRR